MLCQRLILFFSKCFTRVSVEESWEWKMTDKPVERNLLEASVNGLTKLKKKEILNCMRFPHLLSLMEQGVFAKHFPDESEYHQQNIRIINKTILFKPSAEESTHRDEENHEGVDDPEAVYLKEDEVKQEIIPETSDFFILPS